MTLPNVRLGGVSDEFDVVSDRDLLACLGSEFDDEKARASSLREHDGLGHTVVDATDDNAYRCMRPI